MIQNEKSLLLIAILLGIVFKFYDLNAPWGTKDHYNYGGVYTMATTECLKKTPLSESRGLNHILCDLPNPAYYKNHPPTVPFALWGWTSLVGSGEGGYRSFTLLFSVLNIFLLFQIARVIWPEDLRPYWAAAFQALFLGPMYFGTHIDFVTEFTISFILIGAFFALKDRMILACMMSLLAGFTAWAGFISFGPLLLLAFVRRKHVWTVLLIGGLGFLQALGMMMYLNNTIHIIDFFRARMVDVHYITDKKTAMDWRIPFKLIDNIFVSNSRMLSPLFAIFAFYEFFAGEAAQMWRIFSQKKRFVWSTYHSALLLCGGTWLFHAIIGTQYVIVHVFLYLFFVPAAALLCAQFIHSVKNNGNYLRHTRALVFFTILMLARYPFGIFQSNLAQDIFNSVAFVSSVGFFFYLVLKKRRLSMPAVALAGLLIFVGCANFSQMVNYRNEPTNEKVFCEKARKEYLETGHQIVTQERKTMAKDLLYCRGIDIQYPSGELSTR